MQRRRFLFCAVGFVPGFLHAADATGSRHYADLGFTIRLPEGYVGPIEHAAGTSATRAFRKPLPQSRLNTVIMITVQDNGPTFAKRVQTSREALTRDTLERIVDNIARNRANFHRGEAGPVTIAGVPGLKVGWRGRAKGVSFDGIVYCVLIGRRAYAIQIQDPAGLGNALMAAAVRAVEGMHIEAPLN